MRLRALSEAEAYARCYGDADENVRFVTIEPRSPRRFFGVSGEDLRQAFESRLRSREPAHEETGEVPAQPVPGPAPGAVSNGHATGQKPAAAA